MPLRKSPQLTNRLLSANRQNAQQSTGPRTAGGKGRTKLNALDRRIDRKVRILMDLLRMRPAKAIGGGAGIGSGYWATLIHRPLEKCGQLVAYLPYAKAE